MVQYTGQVNPTTEGRFVILLYAAGALACIFCLVLAFKAVVRVQPMTCAVITRKGKHLKVVCGGWHLISPFTDSVFARVGSGRRVVPLKVRAGGGTQVYCDVRVSLVVRCLLSDSAAVLVYELADLPPYTGGTKQATINTNRIAYVQDQGAAIVQQTLINVPLEDLLGERDKINAALLDQLTDVTNTVGLALESVEITEVNAPHELYQTIKKSEVTALEDTAMIRRAEAEAEALRIKKAGEKTAAALDHQSELASAQAKQKLVEQARLHALTEASAKRDAAVIVAEAMEIQQRPMRDLITALSNTGLGNAEVGSIIAALFATITPVSDGVAKSGHVEDSVATRELHAVDPEQG